MNPSDLNRLARKELSQLCRVKWGNVNKSADFPQQTLGRYGNQKNATPPSTGDTHMSPEEGRRMIRAQFLESAADVLCDYFNGVGGEYGIDRTEARHIALRLWVKTARLTLFPKCTICGN